jgi:hypothetical protein
LSTEKILKTHLKKQHGNILPPASTKPLVASVVYNPVGRPKNSDEPKQKKIKKNKELLLEKVGSKPSKDENNNSENENNNSENENNNSENNNSENDEIQDPEPIKIVKF